MTARRDLTRGLLTIVAASVLLCADVGADRVDLRDGSVLVGTIVDMNEGTLRIETNFAGELAVDTEEIVDMTTSAPRKVALESGNVLVGEISKTGDRTDVETSLGTLDITDDNIVAVWPPSEPGPELARAKQQIAQQRGTWQYEANAEVHGSGGNTDRFATSGGLAATLSHPDDRLKFFASYEQVEEEGVETADEIAGGIDYERDVTKRQAWYTRLYLERDEIEGLDLRTVAAGGYGYYFVRNPRHELRARTGLFLRQEAYEDGRSDQTVGIDFGAHHASELAQWIKIVNDITYTPALDDFGDYRLDHESLVETPLAGTDNWKLRLGVENEYNSMPPADKEKLDTSYFDRLVLRWGE